MDLISIAYVVCRLLGSSLDSKKTVNIQPVHEGIEPLITCPIGIAKAKAVSAVLIKMKLYWPPSFEPRFNHTELAAEKEVIGGYDVKHWWSVLWHVDRPHASV